MSTAFHVIYRLWINCVYDVCICFFRFYFVQSPSKSEEKSGGGVPARARVIACVWKCVCETACAWSTCLWNCMRVEMRTYTTVCVWESVCVWKCLREKVLACEIGWLWKCVLVWLLNRCARGTVTIKEGRIPFVMKRLWLNTLKIMMLFWIILQMYPRHGTPSWYPHTRLASNIKRLTDSRCFS